MFRNFLIVSLVLLASTAPTWAVIVSGHAHLYGQSSHNDIRVLFTQVSPSAHTDSAFTDPLGSFLINLQPGVYNVSYSHAGFATYQIASAVLLSDAVLESIELYWPLSGALGGSLPVGHYQVNDSIYVPDSAELVLLPGTLIAFLTRGKFDVKGSLLAEGTPSDSVVFTKRYTAPDSLWGGIALYHSNGPSRFEYSVIEGGGGTSHDYHYSGGGIGCWRSNLIISHCAFRGNRVSGEGGGLALFNADIVVAYSEFDENEAEEGGGLYCEGSSPWIANCIFASNLSANGGALTVYGHTPDSSPTIINCVFSGNRGYDGSGLELHSANAIVRRCLLTANQETSLYLYSDNSAISECMIVGPTHDFRPVVNFMSSTTTVNSCVVVYNGVGGSVNEGSGIAFTASGNSSLLYCDIFGGGAPTFDFDSNDPSNGPIAIGEIALSNAHGDPCDTYFNIYDDPRLDEGYHLYPTSPCIDAGDPNLPRDPDGTVADIGAYYYSQLGAGSHREIVPQHFALHQNFPNPFNAQTRISFDLSQPSFATVEVFDLAGRSVKRVDLGSVSAGTHEMSFDGSDLASGVYFYRVQAGAMAATRKMVLLK